MSKFTPLIIFTEISILYIIRLKSSSEIIFVILVFTTIMRRNSSYINDSYLYQLDDYLNGFGNVTTSNYWMGLNDQYRILEQSMAVDLYITFDGFVENLTNFAMFRNNEYSMNYSNHIDDKPCGK